MNEVLTTIVKDTHTALKQRTGFLGFGPTYYEIIATAILGYVIQRSAEKSVVREAENILAEIDTRNNRL